MGTKREHETPEEKAARKAAKQARKRTKRADRPGGDSKPLKKRCCRKYWKKGKACTRCPIMAKLPEARQAALLAKGAARHAARKAAKKAAKRQAREAAEQKATRDGRGARASQSD